MMMAPPPPPQVVTAPFQAAWERNLHNSAHRHPVFFTARLRKPLSELVPAAHLSPVAHGYAYQEAQRGSEGAVPKL
jgi:hypothetical protein